MSAARVDFTPEALREIDDAFEWYLERSPQAAEAFLREVDSGFAVIASASGIWPRFEAGTRRYVLRNFPYSIIYTLTETEIVIISCFHQRRDPDEWRMRL